MGTATMTKESLAQECVSSRRVIFPSLHPQEKPDNGKQKEAPESVSRSPTVDQPRSRLTPPRSFSFSDSDSTPPDAVCPLNLSPISSTSSSSVPTNSEPPPEQRPSLNANETSTRTPNKSAKLRLSPKSLVIPPFKGDHRESGSLFQQPQGADNQVEDPPSFEEKNITLFQASQSPPRYKGFPPDSLVIPPFKGDCKESGSLFQQTQEADIQVEEPPSVNEEKNHSFLRASQSLPRHRDHSRKPPPSILRSKSKQMKQPCFTATKEEGTSTTSSVSRLASIREEEAEGSETTADTSTPELGYSRSLDCMRSVSFDPRVWVFEFERSKEEFDTTWFSQKEMTRFKKAALIKLYVHAVRQEELIPTGTGRIVRRPVRIPTRALFTNPALTMEGDTDDGVRIEAEKEACREMVVKENHNVRVIDLAC